MPDVPPEKDNQLMTTLKILALCIALPSTLLFSFFVLNQLMHQNLISPVILLIIMVMITISSLFTAYRYARKIR